MTDNTTDFFDNTGGGAGAPTAVLKNPDDFVVGEVVEMFKRDYIPFGKDKPEEDKSEEDGKRKQLVIILQTEERNWANVVNVPRVDPADKNSAEKAPSEDDGKRAVYVPNRSNVQWAIGRAVTAASEAAGKAVKFGIGGTLGVKITNLKDTGKGNPLKEHEAVYKPQAAGSEFFSGGQEATQSAPATESKPAEQAPAPAAQDPWATSSPAASTGSKPPPF